VRNRSGWHQDLSDALAAVWPSSLTGFSVGDLLDVELGLFLLTEVMPHRQAADAWTLFGGYPYSEAFGDVTTPAQHLMTRRVRHYLWDKRRRYEWHREVRAYLTVPEQLRGFDLKGVEDTPVQREPAHAPGRFDVYRRLLTMPPAFERRDTPIAGDGEYWFPVRDRRFSVFFDADLAGGDKPCSHDLDAPTLGGGGPLEVEIDELHTAAEEMDELEKALPARKRGHWVRRLKRVSLLVRDEQAEAFVPGRPLRIDSLLNMVGMVGAGKSTLRDILAYWAAIKKKLRVVIVVGDVAEELALVGLFNRLGADTAPVIGHSTREKHLTRLHRRVATAGAPAMIEHQHDGFSYLSSACAVDALRGLGAPAPLRIGEAPCQLLYPTGAPEPTGATPLFGADEDEEEKPRSKRSSSAPKRHLCPLWFRCPRHEAARELVDARIWVANPMSLVHSGLPEHLNKERMRYLEAACRLADLVIVDEADRVQMQLDMAFAPSMTLVGKAPNSWLDEVAGHKVAELARDNRIQLSRHDVSAWITALDTVSAAVDQFYARIVPDEDLRKWITEDYFSPFTLHQWLIATWFPDLRQTDPATHPEGRSVDDRSRVRDGFEKVLNDFRDDPLSAPPSEAPDSVRNQLVRLALQVLHDQDPEQARGKLGEVLLRLVDGDPGVAADLERQAKRFEFTLIVAVMQHYLDQMTALWPLVEAALNLESTSNVLSRRPPKDFEAIIPESPMGNVLGFQFQRTDRVENGGQSGELRFFRCNGVGRELLLELARMPEVDGRPGPNVLLLSATSWAGESSRYHVHAPVGAILRPHDDEVEAVLETVFRKEFLYWSEPGADGRLKALRLSGAEPGDRERVLIEMLRQLAVPDRALVGAISRLQAELNDIEDPERRRLLLLVGSYAEAATAVDYLNSIPEWRGRVTRLVSDDADLDDAWMTLRRGDIATFPSTAGEILVAPLLAVERGHNIVIGDGRAAIGTAYFLARPHPRPDDISLAVQAVNDWAVRQLRTGEFHQAALAQGTPDLAGVAFRKQARAKWNRFLTRRLIWSTLPDEEKRAFTWDQLVVIWQVVGRLVRGGVAARAVFVDAAFAPNEAGYDMPDTPATSLLVSMRELLAPYFDPESVVPPIERSLVAALYEPLFRALYTMD